LQFQQMTQRHLFYTLHTKLTLRFKSLLLVTAWYSMNSLRSRCQVLEGRHGTKVKKLRCFFKRWNLRRGNSWSRKASRKSMPIWSVMAMLT
jgi:hypothetical protein